MATASAETRILTLRTRSAILAVVLDEVLRVVRPLPVTRVPRAPACVEGLANLEHDIIPVLDLGRALGIRAAGPDERKKAGGPPAERVVLVEVDGQPVGLHVDAVEGIRRILPDLVAT